MSRIATLILAGAVVTAAIGSPAQAQGLSDRFGQDGEASGMFILRIPFGDPAAKSVKPEFGLQVGAHNQAERQYRADRHEPRYGARVPTHDTDSIPTWKIEPSDGDRPKTKAETKSERK